MKHTNSEFDKYIAHAAASARPILAKIRALFHEACPEIEETVKWNTPHFECDGIVGSMAAFKQHVRWGFWKATLMSDPHNLLTQMGDTTMGGGKITDIAQLPPESVIIDYVREAVLLNKQGVKAPISTRSPRPKRSVPDCLAAALKKNKKARATFDAFNASQQREYVEWIVEAKQDATRDKRLAQAIEWMADGKPRNWKYNKK